MSGRTSAAARRAALRRWEQAGRPPCDICGTQIGDGEATHADHIVLRAKGGSDDPANLRIVHAVCNRARNGDSMTLARLLYARKLGLASFKATDRYSTHRGRHIDVPASYLAGRLTDCPRSRSPLTWLMRAANTRGVSRAMAHGDAQASELRST